MADEDENYGVEDPARLIRALTAVQKDDVEGIATALEEVYKRGWENHQVWTPGGRKPEEELAIQRAHAVDAERTAVTRTDNVSRTAFMILRGGG